MAALATLSASVALPLADLAGALDPADGVGDTAETGPRLILVVANADAAPHTATIANPNTQQGLPVADGELVVPNGSTGLYPLSDIFRGANSRAAITYDDVTGLTVGVIRLEG